MALIELPLAPFTGYKDASTRLESNGSNLVGGSSNWLVGRGVLTRRSGSSIVGTAAAGLLPEKWGALARRMFSLRLPSSADSRATWGALWINETSRQAQLGWWSTNGTDALHTIGQEYGAYHFGWPSTRADGIPTLRCVPYLYEAAGSGCAIARLATATDRRHLAGGSRSVVQRGGGVCWPGYYSAPGRWNGRWNDSASSGDEYSEVYPLGMLPPLSVPLLETGPEVDSAVVGSWEGSDAFCYSVSFENEDGELSMPFLPRMPDGPWDGHPGIGYHKVRSSNTDKAKCYAYVRWTGIPVGPPGTRYVHLMRSAKVDARTGETTSNFPATWPLYFCARVPNGVTEYVDENGNDNSLDADPRLTRMPMLVWPPRGRYMGRWDGHYVIGDLRPNPYALLVAPWVNGGYNLELDDARLYGDPKTYVAVTRTKLIVRSVYGTTETDTEFDIVNDDPSLRDVVDALCMVKDSNSTSLTLNWDGFMDVTTHTPGTVNPAHIVPGGNDTPAYQYKTLYNGTGSAITGINQGDRVRATNLPAGAKVASVEWLSTGYIVIDKAIPEGSAAGGELVTFITAGTTTGEMLFSAQVVPGADAEEKADQLQRTLIETTATVMSEQPYLWPAAADVDYIVPGMKVWATGVFTGAVVTENDGTKVTVDTDALPGSTGSHSATFAFDCGDDNDYGYIRTFAPGWPVALPWRKSYLDRFKPQRQSLIFSGADPGHAQYAVNSWYADNRRTGPDDVGLMMGIADLVRSLMVFYTRGRMLLTNDRTGETHNDADYVLRSVSWARGCVSPWSIVNGNGWAAFLSHDGFFACDAQGNEVLLSRDIYDPGRPVGERGILEYAVGQCVAACELADPDGADFAVSADLRGDVLCVHFKASASSTYMDREIRYDFSESVGRTGLAEVLRAGGQPYGWSAPLTLPGSCSLRMSTSAGSKSYMARDDNAGTGDGRVDEVDTGTEDNGEPVAAVGYTGIATDPGGARFVPQLVRFVGRKQESGLTLWAATDPETDPASAEWQGMPLPAAGTGGYIRSLENFPRRARHDRSALVFKVMDDGSGDCPEVMRLTALVEPQEGVV